DPIFVINIPLIGPIIAAILKSITPFREIRETGVVDFFDSIFGLAKASTTAGEKVKGIFKSTIKFLLKAAPAAGREVIGDKKPNAPNSPSISVSNNTTDSTNKSTSNTNNTNDSNSMEDELKDIKSCARKQYIIEKYNDCINKNTKELSSNIGGIQRAKIQSQNISGKLKCDMEKIKRIQYIIAQEQDEENNKPIKPLDENK
ncbi:MAG: hypothetical protein ACO25K_08150, partial [Candidatus Fonsibacter ubiquis]